jgi:hypothetical protein
MAGFALLFPEHTTGLFMPVLLCSSTMAIDLAISLDGVDGQQKDGNMA